MANSFLSLSLSWKLRHKSNYNVYFFRDKSIAISGNNIYSLSILFSVLPKIKDNINLKLMELIQTLSIPIQCNVWNEPSYFSLKSKIKKYNRNRKKNGFECNSTFTSLIFIEYVVSSSSLRERVFHKYLDGGRIYTPNTNLKSNSNYRYSNSQQLDHPSAPNIICVCLVFLQIQFTWLGSLHPKAGIYVRTHYTMYSSR